ncbi:hypothetical protein FQN57_004517 [Myotisia sp. PD_48]|nr:hypothetical protein FQN57_004517 [Myotisia sp. PD_48]
MEVDSHLPDSAQHALSPTTPSPSDSPTRANGTLSPRPEHQHRHQTNGASIPESGSGAILGNPGAAGASTFPDTTTVDPLADLKRPRACEACRQLKVRCDPDPDNLDGPCKRCAKAGRRCVVTVPTRKRQKKGDSRVAELEKKIDALTASLRASRSKSHESIEHSAQRDQTEGYNNCLPTRWLGQYSVRNDGRSSIPLSNRASPPGLAGSKRHFSGEIRRGQNAMGILAPLNRSLSPSGEGPSPAAQSGSGGGKEWPVFDFGTTPKLRVDHEYADVIDRGVVDHEIALKAFDRYVTEMAPLMPAVVFPPGTTMAEIRREKPILFHSILSISVGSYAPSLQMPLVNEVHKLFAEHVIIRGEKSLELIQALILGCLWYMPPDHYEEIKIYQLIHMAAVMGMDLGMNRRSKSNSKSAEIMREIMGKKAPYIDPESLDGRRVWAGCYFMGVNAAMGLRRPLLTRWNAYLDESVQMFEESPEALPSDKALVEWIKLARLGEEISFRFSMDDPVTNISISDPTIQYALKGFEGHLDEWRRKVPKDVYSPIMQHYEHVLNIYMHEIGMHIDHNIDDFKPPFLTGGEGDAQVNVSTAAHVDALTACLTSIHKALQIFGSVDWATLPCVPTIHFVRTAYTCVALIKLYSATTASGSRLADIFHPADFKIEETLDNLMSHLHSSTEQTSSRIGAKFSLIVGMLKAWYKRKNSQQPMVPAIFMPKGLTGENANAQHPITVSSNGQTHRAYIFTATTKPTDDTVPKQEVQQTNNVPSLQRTFHQSAESAPKSHLGQAVTPSGTTVAGTAPFQCREPPAGIHNSHSPSISSWPQYVSQDQINLSTFPAANPHGNMNHIFPNPPQHQNSGYTPNEGFDPSLSNAGVPMGAQNMIWPYAMAPEMDAAFSADPNMWDEEFFQFSLEGGGFDL